MSKVYIAGAAMTPFGRWPDKSAAGLGRAAVLSLLETSAADAKSIQAVYVGRSFAGAIDRQVSVPGQVALRGTGIEDLPVFNFDNACAAVPSALHVATGAIRSGQFEKVLVIGMDKLFARERRRSMEALIGAMDVDEMGWLLDSEAVNGSVFMETYYGRIAKEYLERTGASAADFAKVAVKNRAHAALNPMAQYRTPVSEAEVLAAPIICDPLTKLMCSPLTDGAVAMLVVSQAEARRAPGVQRPVQVLSCVVRSGMPQAPSSSALQRTASQAYHEAGVGPEDLDLAEVHEASAVGELIATEEIGLAPAGDGARLLRDGQSQLGGAVPVNTSGGLLSRGHPGAATGGAQLVELVWQLQGCCGNRQVDGARIGLAHSSGGLIGNEPACTGVTILAAE
jgi:acetyl-CoA acetyltransferase